MIYDVRLVTTSSYESPVPFARHVLRLVPRDRLTQQVIASTLQITPEPSDYRDGVDFFGNSVVWVTFDAPHQRLVVRSSARVSVEPGAAPDAASAAPWEAVAAAAAGSHDISPDSPAHFLFPSRHVRLSAEITDYAARCFPPGVAILDAVDELMRRIHADFRYESGATDVSTPVEAVFEDRRGVCQDFAHLMIAGLRGLGLPAAYVSGFLRTIPPPGGQRLEGADSSHAWVAVWCGPAMGWIGFDPTNAILAREDHVVIAVGRDYADVAPLDGVIVTAGDHHVETAVDVAPVSPPVSPLASA